VLGRRHARHEGETPPRIIYLPETHELAVSALDGPARARIPFRVRTPEEMALFDRLYVDLDGFRSLTRSVERGDHPQLVLTEDGLKVTDEGAERVDVLRNAAAPAKDEDTDMPNAKTPDAPRVVPRKHVEDSELRRQMRETYDQLGRDLERSERGEQPSKRTRVRL
jgi:hypothetical protein